MRKLSIALLLTAVLSTQPIFAEDQDLSSSNKSCDVIAKACLDAGYLRDETADQKLWQDCMKPIILGKTVEGVTVDNEIIKACLSDKINQLKTELNDLQPAPDNKFPK